MIQVTKYRNQRVAVFGLAKSGIATIRALKEGEAEVFAWDDSEQNRTRLLEESRPEYIALSLQESLTPYEIYSWNSLRALVLSPGVPLTYPQPHPIVTLAKKNNCPIIGDIELLYHSCPRATYIGITGTNGKSTTTSLISHILKSCGKRTEVGGNLGIPALELEPLAADGTYVLELSSFQLDLLDDTHLNMAVLLNITPDHIDRHGSMEGYIAAKERIFRHQTAEDTAIISIDNPHSNALYEKLKCENRIGHLIPISTESQIIGGVSVMNGMLINAIDQATVETIPLGKLVNLTGKHNGENIAAAFAVAYRYGIPSAHIIDAIRSFKGLAHRMQYLGEKNGVTYINDSKATNAEATEKALTSFDTIYWIAGGKAKEGGITALAPYFPRIRHAFLIGDAEESFAATLTGKVPFTRCGNLATAFQEAHRMANAEKLPGATVLLSPACASFDQWKNFEERGDAFCEMVDKI
jgi:UDP-N-acetylmuramoylalanine--D-glutamate ligase